MDVLPILAPALAQVMPKPAQENVLPPSEWIQIGTLADFKPGTAQIVLDGRYVVVAHAQGLYALETRLFQQGLQAPRQALRMGAHGSLDLHPELQWPVQTCLSAVTGNRTKEDPQLLLTSIHQVFADQFIVIPQEESHT